MTRALHVIFTAVIVMIAMPVSQLRTMAVMEECCCPDPAKCMCKDHGSAIPGQVTMKACHKSTDVITGSSLTAFHAPAVTEVHEPSRGIAPAQFSLSSPHPPPSPDRPPGPS